MDQTPQDDPVYTVEEAAEILGISRPTLFRWMKQGKLSFYKVGGATRFSRENLDDVARKVTGRDEAEEAGGRCAACGHAELVQGRIQGTGNLYFRPKSVPFWTFSEALVPIRSRVCAACGHVHLNADTRTLDKLTRRTPDAEAPGSATARKRR